MVVEEVTAGDAGRDDGSGIGMRNLSKSQKTTRLWLRQRHQPCRQDQSLHHLRSPTRRKSGHRYRHPFPKPSAPRTREKAKTTPSPFSAHRLGQRDYGFPALRFAAARRAERSARGELARRLACGRTKTRAAWTRPCSSRSRGTRGIKCSGGSVTTRRWVLNEGERERKKGR